MLQRFYQDERGQTIERIILMVAFGVLAIVVAMAVGAFGQNLSNQLLGRLQQLLDWVSGLTVGGGA
jgi:Flp pilus assembly pilin Flp